MYLKSIEIQGFKSFANKTVFEFHNGITCIVGPNGSGKSNVADAVRWVLGEQSAKQLRGANMQDVIFSGTQLRKPQGFAFVSITFDNKDHTLNLDYNEVTVIRRVYRSGESEYLINGSVCRLRDIHELFFDTGIGKEGYSIIGQGQIDMILSSKPDDRRELFDEAAGIVKFKYRKAVAQKRLESEQASMLRLTDIMSELERQTGPLESQSRTAREYLRLREELRSCEVNAFVLESRQLEQSLEELERRLNITGGDYEQTKEEAVRLKQQYANRQESLEEMERTIQADRDSLALCRKESQEKEGYIRVLEEQVRALGQQKDRVSGRLGVLQKELEGLLQEKTDLDTKRQDLNRQIYDATAQGDRTRQESEAIGGKIERLQKAVEDARNQVIVLLNQKSDLLAEVQKYQTMQEQYRIRKAQFDQELLRSKEEEERMHAGLEEHRQAYEAAKTGYEHARQLEEEKRTGCERLSARLQKLQTGYMEQRRVYQVAAARAETLRNLAERYDGYGSSIRRVMEAKGRYPGICGVVADLIHVEKKYETAIETALGGNIQNIVTDTEQTAKELIAYLKRNKYGRATFLPLDAVRDREGFKQREVLKEKGVIGLAGSLVQTEERYKGIVGFLLGRIVVADTIDNGLAVAAKYHRSFRIVTLEGDMLNIGGSMTGGAFKNSSNLLGRARELEELEASMKAQKKKLDDTDTQLAGISESLREAQEELSEARKAAQESVVAQAEARMNCQAAQKRVQEIVSEREQTVLEQKLLERSLQEVKEKRQGALKQVEELEKAGERLQAGAQESKQEEEASSVKKEDLAKEIRRQELALASLEQTDGFLQENLKRVMDAAEKNRQETKELKSELSSLEEQTEEKQLEMEETRKAADEQDRQAKTLTAQIAELTGKRETANDSLRHFFERQEELSNRINALDRDLLRMKAQKERFEEELDGRTDYLWREYEMRPSEARASFTELPGGLSELRKQTESLKSRLKALGSVNVNAIEEYRDLMERWTFMKGQYDDLVASRDSLLGVIDDLDAGMRLQFEKKFAEIKKEFDRVFQELFGGGAGTLELVEGEDVLEAGITIIAQPPGKKLQNMMQLSGGERALTAIALLFAIQNLKPSPFCLLDEIEAALDDSNVGRFARYLHKLSRNTQFIVITHRRGTMTAADRLYGITMQEKGVSALVSVNLIEKQLQE